MPEPMDPDAAQDKLEELGEHIDETKRKVEDDLGRPSVPFPFADDDKGPQWVDSGSESTGDGADDQTIAPG